MLNNIPSELRRLPQWVCAHDDKVPRNPRTGDKADPTDPNTWGTFEEAIRCGMRHIGFVLSKEDPYSAIDLDEPLTEEQANRHSQILEAAESYAEVSQSGKGVHIFVKGKLPEGVRRDKVEVYSDSRYMICTGNVLNALPIAERQTLLDVLFREMKTTKRVGLVEQEAILSDEDLWQMGHDAANGAKFDQLWEGDWEHDYPSQSEADFALMSMLCFYSKSNEQCRRVFRLSKLGKRDKAAEGPKGDRYLDYMLSKCRAHEPQPVDLTALEQRTQDALNNTSTPEVPKRETSDHDNRPTVTGGRVPPPPPGPKLQYPPGLVGELAHYFEASAIRPVREIALVGALGLAAGICARTYNVSGTGLNQYLILLARTGSGKEGIATGIDSLVAALRPQIPMVDRFIGPASFASGQGLVRVLDERPCFVSVLGEIGATLEQMSDPRAPAPTVMLKKALLDIYNKSGWNKVLRPSVYSDTEKNTKIVQAPNVTIVGESTPEEFYRTLDIRQIHSGLLPRFSIVEYLGQRPPRNPRAFQPPPEELVTKLGDLVTIALTASQNSQCCPVQIDSEAQHLLDELDEYATSRINNGQELERELWNRTHLKALKLSALVAVGCDPQNPVITKELAEWARDFVVKDVELLTTRFAQGEVGTGQVRQENDVYCAIKDYLKMNGSERKAYKVPDKLLNEKLVPYHYLRRRLRGLASFKEDRRGVNAALDELLETMVRDEQLLLLPRQQASEVYGVTSPLYALGQMWGGRRG